MNRNRLSSLVLTLPMVLGTLVAQPPSVAAQDHAIVQPRSVVLLRSRKETGGAPAKRKAVVRYPILLGLTDRSVRQRIQKTLAIKNVFDSTLEEYRQDGWLTDFDYRVNYNTNYLLDITFTQSGMGAYPDTQTKHFLISLRTGAVIKAADAFNFDALANVATMVDQKLKAETQKIAKDLESDKETSADEKSTLKDQLEQLKFERENLDEFSVSDKGVTFLYDAGFPHVIKALEPDGRYFFSYAALRPYVKRNGPLRYVHRENLK